MVKTPEAPTSLAVAIDALDERLSQRFIALDPKGYFLIKVDRGAAELILEHYGNTIDAKGLAHDPETGEVLSCRGGSRSRSPSAVFRGRSAKEIGIQLTEGEGASPGSPGSPGVTILLASSVQTLAFIELKHSRPPDLKSSSNVSLPFAWITGPRKRTQLLLIYN